MNLIQRGKINHSLYIIKKLQTLNNKLKNTIPESYIDLYCNQERFDNYLNDGYKIKKLSQIDISSILRDNPYYYHGLSGKTEDDVISKKERKQIKKRIDNLEFYIQNYELYKDNYFLFREFSYNIKLITIKNLNLLMREYEKHILNIINNKDNI